MVENDDLLSQNIASVLTGCSDTMAGAFVYAASQETGGTPSSGCQRDRPQHFQYAFHPRRRFVDWITV
jgi:hypothetical protein